MKNAKNQSFFKLFLKYFIVFLVIVTILKMGISMFKNGSYSGMVNELFATDNWKRFAELQMVTSVIYGLLVAGYYKYIKK